MLVKEFDIELPGYRDKREAIMTWAEFVKWAEINGVKPGDEIAYIDWHYGPSEIMETQEGKAIT